VGVDGLPPLSPGPFSPLGSPQSFVVTPGEDLTITVRALLPDPAPPDASLWLGIASGVPGSSLDGPAVIGTDVAWPEAINGPGVQRYTVHWTVPASLPPGTVRQLIAQAPDGGRVIATFKVAG
jgi:hypothetical protein